MHCNRYVMQFYPYSYLNALTVHHSRVRLCFMSDHLRTGRLELIHEISDLVDRNMLWSEIARLGMTREFIERRGDFFGRIVLELDYIEKKVPDSQPDIKRLRTLVALLSREEKSENLSFPRVA